MAATKVPRLVAVLLLGAAVSTGWPTDARAKGHAGGGHGGGRHGAAHAPKAHAAPHPSSKLPRAPRNKGMKAPATAHANNGKTPKPHSNAKPHPSHKAATAARAGAAGGPGRATSNRDHGAHRSYARGRMPYRYGSSYGRRNYGLNRYAGALASRLRSAHATLARADHDYKGHRVQAMRAVRSAIRQLGHSSRRGYGAGMAGLPGRANRNNAGVRRVGQAQGRPLSQAQSDALMRHARGTLSLVSSHMAGQGGTARTGRAFGYVNRAIRHINMALTVR
jgi:hypothetical protein